MSSGIPPWDVPTTGTPHANASRIPIGAFSYPRDGTDPDRRAANESVHVVPSDATAERHVGRPDLLGETFERRAIGSVAHDLDRRVDVGLRPGRGSRRPSPPTACLRRRPHAPGVRFGSIADASTKFGTHLSRRGNTCAAAILAIMNRLGQRKRSTGSYMRNSVWAASSMPLSVLIESEPSWHRFRLAM